MPTIDQVIEEFRRRFVRLEKRVSRLEHFHPQIEPPDLGPGPHPEPEPDPLPEPEPTPDPGPVPPPSGDHAHFDALVSRSDRLVAYALRDQSEIDRHSQSGERNPHMVYEPDADAMAVWFPRADGRNIQQVRLPVNWSDRGRLLTTWDVIPAQATTPARTFKAFQFSRATEKIHVEIRLFGPWAVDARHYLDGQSLPPGMTDNEPMRPRGEGVLLRPGVVNRLVTEITRTADGGTFSLWVSNGGAFVQIYRNVGLRLGATIDKFWVEFNTSSVPHEGPRSRVCWVRNVVCLTDAPLSALLVQP